MVTAAKAVTNDMRMSDVIDGLSFQVGVVGVAGTADPNVPITFGRSAMRMHGPLRADRPYDGLLVTLFDLAAAVDNEVHVLAVLRCLHDLSFVPGFDVSDLRIARGRELGDELLLRQGLGQV